MKKVKKSQAKLIIINVFGVIGYIASFLLWFWLLALGVSALQTQDFTYFDKYIKSETPSIPAETLSLPPTVIIIIGVIVTLAAIAIAIYALIKLPVSTVRRTSEYVVKTSEKILPLLDRKQLTKKKRIKLRSRTIAILKLLLILLPLTGSIVLSKTVDHIAIESKISIIVSLFLSCLALSGFAIQIILATLTKSDLRKLI